MGGVKIKEQATYIFQENQVKRKFNIFSSMNKWTSPCCCVASITRMEKFQVSCNSLPRS